MGLTVWLAQNVDSTPNSTALPAWWPVAALVIPLVVTLIVAIIQMKSSIKVAKIQADSGPGAKAKTEDIAEQVMRVLGEELDRRLGPSKVAEAQHAYDLGREESEKSALIAAHKREITELQAQLAARDAEPKNLHPESVGATMLYNAGYDAQQSGKLGEAVGLYSAAILLDSSHAKAFYNRGNAKYELGDRRGAIEDYDQAIQLDPNDSKACYNCGNAKFDLGDLRGAIDDYSESVRLDPSFTHAFYNRGNARAALDETTAAIEDYRRVIELDSGYSAAYYNIGCQSAKLGLANQAMDYVSKAFDLDSRWANHAKTDSDLELLHGTEAFEDLIKKNEPLA